MYICLCIYNYTNDPSVDDPSTRASGRTGGGGRTRESLQIPQCHHANLLINWKDINIEAPFNPFEGKIGKAPDM